MHGTIHVLKTILKFILYAGAVTCCLAGLEAIYAAITRFREPNDPPHGYALVAIYVCLAFTPGFIFLKGSKTKTWQWLFTAIVEAIVLAPALYVLLVRIGFFRLT